MGSVVTGESLVSDDSADLVQCVFKDSVGTDWRDTCQEFGMPADLVAMNMYLGLHAQRARVSHISFNVFRTP